VIVLDASAVVEWLLGLPHAREVGERLADSGHSLHVPHLLAVEVTQVVRRYEAAGEITTSRAVEALGDLTDLDATRHDHEPLLPLVWHFRANLTAYDAIYVALSLALDAPLVTLDGRLAAAPHDAVVDLVG
jgi:predicted nucleic acid-binding protein